MKLKYFKNVKTVQELKEEFRELAKKYHPDLGGTNEEMKALLEEYEYLHGMLPKTGAEKAEDVNEYTDVINAIINLSGIKIEVVGTWVWVSGNTYEVKEALKQAGFIYAKRKKKWFWKPADYKKRNKHTWSYEKIKAKYGVKEVIDNREGDEIAGVLA